MRIGFLLLLGAALATSASAQNAASAYVPELSVLQGTSASELRDVVERYVADRNGLQRRFRVEGSPARRAALRDYYSTWLARLDQVAFDAMGPEGRVDWLLLRNEVAHERDELAREERRMTELAPLLPFAETIYGLEETRRRLATLDPPAAARALDALAEEVRRVSRAAETGARSDTARGGLRPTRIAAFRAAALAGTLRETLQQWFRYYDGYDPLFSWWARAPHLRADSALRGYVQVLRERVLGIRPGEPDPIVGLPIGREAILEDLAFEMIPYTPEELVAIAQRELAWCEAEMRRAARDMGLGDDWRAALERVKNAYVEPGRQTDLVRDLAREAIAYMEANDLVTVPPLAKDIWRMEMMSPERQREAPFFLGGEVIQVSYPTETMSQDDKLMSMRGNNPHFSRATVHHELIPGHHLQGFMTNRYQTHRQVFGTPFWSEGNAFYWETILWDRGFTSTPQDRVGALFWRMHRAARIIFSLGFHLGTMTPQQCIDFLVERVGHERANATAEVRRSFNGNYSPLYQVAYMIGGLQFRALHQELVGSGRMTDRAFHDAILRGGSMPVEMVRARLTGQRLTRDWRPNWRFAGERPGR